MEDPELEQLRQKRMQELQHQSQQEQQSQIQLAEQLEQLEGIVKQRMTRDALLRYGNIRAAHPEKALQILAVMGEVMQSGRVQEITDEMVKQVLQKLLPQKKDFNLRRV